MIGSTTTCLLANKGKASNCYTDSRKAKREDTEVVMTAVLADEELMG
jgi:hypothetical protein